MFPPQPSPVFETALDDDSLDFFVSFSGCSNWYSWGFQGLTWLSVYFFHAKSAITNLWCLFVQLLLKVDCPRFVSPGPFFFTVDEGSFMFELALLIFIWSVIGEGYILLAEAQVHHHKRWWADRPAGAYSPPCVLVSCRLFMCVNTSWSPIRVGQTNWRAYAILL